MSRSPSLSKTHDVHIITICQGSVQSRLFVCWSLKSQHHASISQGRTCSDKCTCCHTETEVVDQTFHLTQSQYTDIRPNSPSADPHSASRTRGNFSPNCTMTSGQPSSRNRWVPTLRSRGSNSHPRFLYPSGERLLQTTWPMSELPHLTNWIHTTILFLLLQRSTAMQVSSSVRLMPQNQSSGRDLLPNLTAWSPDQHPAAMLADVSQHVLGRAEGRGLGFGQLVRTHTGKCLKC